jgi:hypothetical protein
MIVSRTAAIGDRAVTASKSFDCPGYSINTEIQLFATLCTLQSTRLFIAFRWDAWGHRRMSST